MTTSVENPVLVTGGTGTVGRRVVAQLRAADHPVRAASRHTDPPLDWDDEGTWARVLDGARRMYLLLPDDTPLPDGFLDAAADAGVRRVALHSDRGVEAMGPTHLVGAEQVVRASALDWTVVRPDWFAQDFETFFRETVVTGRLCLPVGEARQGFVDADDIAAVAVRVLTSDEHLGSTLELTGPTALSFREACALIAAATGRPVAFDGTPEAYRTEMRAAGLPDEVVEPLVERFGRLAARGDTAPTGVVEAVVGRPARPFADYVADAAARGVWGATSAYRA